MFLPLMVILLGLLRGSDGRSLDPSEASDRVIASMFSSTILVLIASFVIASAFNKMKLTVLGKTNNPGQKKNIILVNLEAQPSLLILTCMVSVLLASFFMPSLSAALLAISIVGTRKLNEKNSGISKAILMGIVVSGNIGGLVSPISSLQSVFAFHLAMDHLQATWSTWLKSSIPTSLITILVSWLFIIFYYDIIGSEIDEQGTSPAITEPSETCTHSTIIGPNNEMIADQVEKGLHFQDTDETTHTNQIEPSQMTLEQKIERLKILGTIIITVLTVILWSNAAGIESRFLGGSMGISALIPIILFYGLRILPANAINEIPWDIILMAMGTLVLNEAAKSSGLIASIGHQLSDNLVGLSYPMKILFVCMSVIITGTFKSHFVAGLVFLPIVLGFIQKIGIDDEPHGVAMFIAAAQATSIGMALPVSGLINISAASVCDIEDGNRVLSPLDFVIVGGVCSLIGLAALTAIGLPIILYNP